MIGSNRDNLVESFALSDELAATKEPKSIYDRQVQNAFVGVLIFSTFQFVDSIFSGARISWAVAPCCPVSVLISDKERSRETHAGQRPMCTGVGFSLRSSSGERVDAES